MHVPQRTVLAQANGVGGQEQDGLAEDKLALLDRMKNRQSDRKLINRLHRKLLVRIQVAIQQQAGKGTRNPNQSTRLTSVSPNRGSTALRGKPVSTRSLRRR